MGDSSKALPKNHQEWQGRIAERNLAGKTVHGAELASASKIKLDQFLLLRILWDNHEGSPESMGTLFGMPYWITTAKAMLANYTPWKTYCDSFTAGKIPEGTFATARHCQLEVSKTKEEADPHLFSTPIARRTRGRLERDMANLDLHSTPSKRSNKQHDKPVLQGSPGDPFGLEDDSPSPFKPVSPIPKELETVLYPPTKDEQIVNTALIIFLNALTLHFSLSCSWTLHRMAFTANFGSARFEARTDGYLDDHRGKPSALIEVKPVLRSRQMDLIQMQESAQMVSWIKNDSDLANGQDRIRILISQDRHFIFITVAEYDADYLAYLKNEKPSTDTLSFLTMHQFGPWDTQRASHMRELGPILLAITLRAEAESKGMDL
ncbi:uncharacterized protein N7459_006919 [Penicillium hispanicum]|uniref:uncharacterized protein n=1 Tax=Penicillium hispanicum TaxID=1080232 RepID=UPI002540650A|nr:uncharacterized protein N7459_006919 [Penicillium hispanicum]KAJ5577955.1 hypothetical protein N7459_006919 [Penicillium hispanicum]